jgi:hypothetical protein
MWEVGGAGIEDFCFFCCVARDPWNRNLRDRVPGILKLLLGRNDWRNAIAVLRHALILAQIPGADYVYVSLKEAAMSGGGKG